TGVGELRPAPRFTLAVAVRVQYAWKSLLSFEQFAGGNYTVGRGYDPGAIIGDRGFGTQLEMRYGSRIAQSARKPAVEGYGFWDEASVSNRDHISSTGGAEHLNSVGTGVRMSWQRFSLGTSFCSAQSLTVDKALTGMFDAGYSITCRDAVLPVGKLYKIRSAADAAARLAADRADRADCQPARHGSVVGVGAVDVFDCKLK